MTRSLTYPLAVVVVLSLYVAAYAATFNPWGIPGKFRIPHYSTFSRRSFLGYFFAPAQYADEHFIRPAYWHGDY